MSAKEILTLQFGHYPNYIGTHWWNIQEAGFNYNPNDVPSEINHDVLYREGLTSKGEVTFTPRLLLADLKDSLKTLTEHGNLYEDTPIPEISTVPWNKDKVEIKHENSPAKNELQEALTQPIPETSGVRSKCLENNIDVWSDFLYTRYHPRTVNIVNQYRHNDKDRPFDTHNLGKEIWCDTHFGEEFSDKIRNYIEECDSLQGFQLMLDPTDSFGGLSISCLEHIKDEYSRKSVLALPVLPSYHLDYNIQNQDDRVNSTLKDSIRLVNLLLTLKDLTEHCCLTIPLCTGMKGWRQPGPKINLKYLNYNQNNLYHTSAILASAIDTFTMPYRLKTSAFTMADFCADLNTYGRKISAASIGMPFGLKTGENLIDFLDKTETPLWQSLTPNCSIETDKTSQHVTIRGIAKNRLKTPTCLAEDNEKAMPAFRCETTKEMLTYYLQCVSFYTTSHVTSLNTALPTVMPYPDIFDERIDDSGNITNYPSKGERNVTSVPVVAGVHCFNGISHMLEILHRESKRVKISKFHQFMTSGLEEDEYNETLHKILDLKDCYEESFNDEFH